MPRRWALTDKGERILARIAGAVADGEAVDWKSAERIVPTERQGAMRALRTIADSGTDPTLAGDVSHERSEPVTSTPPWLWLIIGLGACQLALGIAGFLVGVSARGFLAPAIWERAAMLAFGGTALWLVRGGLRDRRALWLAAVYMTVASAFAGPPAAAFAVTLFPSAQQLPLFRLAQVEVFMPFCLWSFVRSFPRVFHLERGEKLIRVAIVVTAAYGAALWLLNAGAAVGLLEPQAKLAGAPALGGRGQGSAYWGLLSALAAPALLVSMLRARYAPPSEQRRVARFALGLALGLGPMVVEILAEALVPPFRRMMDTPVATTLGSLILFPPLLFVPILTARAVVAHRLLSVGPLFGRAGHYLLARTTLALITIAPLVMLAFYLYRHRDQPLTRLLAGTEGLLLMGIGAVGLLLLAFRSSLTRRLDLMFERSQADWTKLRLRAGQAVRKGGATREAADALLTDLARELSVDSAKLLVPARESRSFVPLSGKLRPLSYDSALPSLSAADPSPLFTDPADPESVFSLLPTEDQRWLTETRTALLIPLVGASGATAGLLALGAKRNDAPFSPEERWELSDLAQAVGLALEHKRLQDTGRAPVEHPGDEAQPANECPRCRLVHPSTQSLCRCGTLLVAAPLPRVLLGKLELEERLGQGGMGVVYRALDRDLARHVAVKTLSRVSPGAAERLRQEARSMAAVNHPAVAVIHGSDSWHGLRYLVVEHLAGGTLARRMRSPWPVDQALHLGIKLADALDAIHRKGLLHRDVKPSNIGFDGESHPKLLDFGLARLIDPTAGPAADGGDPSAPPPDVASGTWGAAGTPIYLPPEVLAGDPPSPQQDLWGLALVLFELIAGVHPFRGDNMQQTLANVRLVRLKDLRTWAPACPEPVALFFTRALHADPRQRPASAAALQAELGALL